MNPIVTLPSWPKVADVNAFFPSVTQAEIASYNAHWSTLGSDDYLETFQRWLFAFCSVHTTWQGNVKGYEAIRSWISWYQAPDELKRKLAASGVGLQHNRTRFIALFCEKYWNNPSFYYKKLDEDWVQYRDRLVKDTLGLGPAKVSFAIELMYPTVCEVTCFDTHMFQFYGLDQTKHSNQYPHIERHWVSNSLAIGVPPAVARAIFWDRKQNRTDSKYWTYVIDRSTSNENSPLSADTPSTAAV